MELKGKRILVVGAGRTGFAVSRFLVEKGARVVVSDLRPAEDLGEKLDCLVDSGIKVETGGHLLETFLDSELIVVSPGVTRTLEALVEAEKRGIKVISEIELASKFIDVPIIAVTGTNGKTTTTSVLGRILEGAGERVFVGGNIGNPLIEYPYRLLSRNARQDIFHHDGLFRACRGTDWKSQEGEGKKVDYVVAEISSFQLEGIRSFRPHIGIILNISEDHLDRYSSYLDYVNTKFRLFKNQDRRDFAVVNRDDPLLSSLSRGLRTTVLPFSKKERFKEGIYLKGEDIVFSWRGKEEVYPIKGLRLKGNHNVENIMAVIGAAKLLGVEMGFIIRGIEGFDGLSHRMEWIRDLNGVTYFNDSKATNVGAVVSSLQSFDRPIILIAGGKDKGGNYRPLRESVIKKVKKLILMGEAKERIREILKDCTDIVLVKSLEDAIFHAFRRAISGDVVLFSPACSSYDVYRDYEERGDHFRSLVAALGPPDNVEDYQSERDLGIPAAH